MLKPVDDVVIVERDKPLTESHGIILPPAAQTELDQGTVIAVGPGKRSTVGTILPIDIKVGDRVIFSKYANLSFEHEGKSLITMREGDIIGTLDGD